MKCGVRDIIKTIKDHSFKEKDENFQKSHGGYIRNITAFNFPVPETNTI